MELCNDRMSSANGAQRGSSHPENVASDGGMVVVVVVVAGLIAKWATKPQPFPFVTKIDGMVNLFTMR